jgi:hypothetical protein
MLIIHQKAAGLKTGGIKKARRLDPMISEAGFLSRGAVSPHAREVHKQPDLQWDTRGTIYRFIGVSFP